MNGLLIGLLAWSVMCLALLILVLGAYDDVRAQLAREKALRNLENGTPR